MTDHDLIREARKPRRYGKLTHELADALEAAVARANQLEKALREVHEYNCGCDRPGSISSCVAQPVVVFDVLARVPAEPATEEKP